MDVFLEYLLDKKNTAADVLKKLGIVAAAILVMFILMNVFMMFGRIAVTYLPLAIAALVYGTYILLRNFNIEYEYIFTNGELDIDVIKGRKVRKRLTSLSTKHIELMAKQDSDLYRRDFENDSIAKKYNAVYNPAKGNIFCALYSVDGVRTLLTFQPPEKLVEAMKKMNPRAVHEE